MDMVNVKREKSETKKGSIKSFFSKLIHMKYFSLTCWLIGLVILWEIVATYVGTKFRTPENYLPHLYQIIASIFTAKTSNTLVIKTIFGAAGNTLLYAVIGFIIGIIVGYLFAVLMSLFKFVEKIMFPYLILIQMIPILGMAPVIFAMTGNSGDASKIIIAAILTFYPISTNVLAGFKSVEKEKHDLMSLCAANIFQKYFKTMIPAGLPYFFTGLKIAAPLALTSAMLVDTLQTGNNLGSLLSQSLKGGMTRYVFWQIVLLSAVIGVGSTGLMGLLERIILRYKYPRKKKLRK